MAAFGEESIYRGTTNQVTLSVSPLRMVYFVGRWVRDAYTYKLQIEGFADTILNDAPMHGAGVDDGVAAMRAMAAITRSVETGQSVRLADVTGSV